MNQKYMLEKIQHTAEFILVLLIVGIVFARFFDWYQFNFYSPLDVAPIQDIS